MVNPIPDITVVSEIRKIKNANPLIRDVTCLIGCFEDTETLNTPTLCKSLPEAEKIFGDDTQYDGNAALKQIFHKDISGCLIINCTTVTGSGENPSINTNLTEAKIRTALNLVRLIDFDLLYVACEYTDSILTVVDDFANSRFEDKRPFDYSAVGTRNSEALYSTTAEKIGDRCAAFLTQPLGVNGEELTLIESGAYLTNLIATLPVGNSLTAKVLDEVTSLGTEYTFECNDDGTPKDLGAKLVGFGFFVVRLINALENTYECVNSAGPNGLDLYMTRVTTYIVNEFALRQALGEHNNISMELIKMECGRLYNKFIDTLGLIKDIVYTVEKEDAETVNVLISELIFAGIVTKINVYITIGVE